MIWGEEKELSSVHHFSCPEKTNLEKKDALFFGGGGGVLKISSDRDDLMRAKNRTQ